MVEKLSHWSDLVADFPCYWDPKQPAVYRNNFSPTNTGELSSEIRKEAKRKLGSRVPQRMFRKKIKAEFRLNKRAFIFPQRIHAETWHLNFISQDFCLLRFASKAPKY